MAETTETTTIKFLSAKNLPTLIAKVKDQIVASETRAKEHANAEIAKLPSVADALAEAKEYADGKYRQLLGDKEDLNDKLDTIGEIAEALNNDAGTVDAIISSINDVKADVQLKADKSALEAAVSDVNTLTNTVYGQGQSIESLGNSITTLQGDVATAQSTAESAQSAANNALSSCSSFSKTYVTKTTYQEDITNLRSEVDNKVSEIYLTNAIDSVQSSVDTLSAKAFTTDNMVELTDAEVDAYVAAAFK